MTMTYNLIQLKSWAEKSGIPFWTTPQAKNTVDGYGGRGKCRRCNTCEVCPTGARYSPDWTFKQLLDAKKIQLHDQTLVRKLVLDDKTTRIVAAQAVKEDGSARTTSSTARRRSSSRPATAGARTCCCCRRTRDSRTGSRTRPTTSAAT